MMNAENAVPAAQSSAASDHDLEVTEQALESIIVIARDIASVSEELLRAIMETRGGTKLPLLRMVSGVVPALLQANHEQLRSVATMLDTLTDH